MVRAAFHFGVPKFDGPRETPFGGAVEYLNGIILVLEFRR